MKKGQIIECRIESIAFGGAGVARVVEPPHDGLEEREFVVFVNGVVAGDVVEARVVRRKKKYAEAVVERFLTKSNLRIEPRCKHFGVCGGCRFQFLDYEKQLEVKQSQVKDALERIGGLKLGNDGLLPIIGCEEPWFYRNKMEFSFSWNIDPRKLPEGEDPVLSVGLHPAGKRFESIDIEDCYLQSEWVVGFLGRLRDFARKEKWTPFNFRTGEGFVRSIFVREGKWTGEKMVNLVIGNEDKKISEMVERFFEWMEKTEPDVDSAYLTVVRAERGKKTEIDERLMFGKKVLRDEIRVSVDSADRAGGNELSTRAAVLKFDILPQAFFQPNTKQAGILYEQIFRFADIGEESVVFDLFCGTGTIALFCAQKSGKVYGIELNESAVKNARTNAELNELDNVEFVVGDVGEMVEGLKDDSGEKLRPDVIVMDPPRAGVGEAALEKVLGFEAGEIVYVSCNPTTFARDLKFLTENGYELIKVQPVDMFPQTAHVECVGYLRRI